MENKVKRALENCEPTFGSWLQIGAYPAIAEILAIAGFEWLAVDCEHSDIAVEGFTDLARGMAGHGCLPLARVRENDTLAIRQMLDAGAMGVIVPLVNTAEEAKKAVAAAKYPPQGVRGFCFSRMNRYGVDFEAYAREANDNIAVVVMIESKQAVENIDAILDVEGVDGVLIGPYDLSGSYGLPGKLEDPRVTGAVQTVLEACEAHHKSAGMHLVQPTPDAILDLVERGFTFLALGVDMIFLRNAADAAVKAASAARGMLEWREKSTRRLVNS